jgi:hypothetical protein
MSVHAKTWTASRRHAESPHPALPEGRVPALDDHSMSVQRIPGSLLDTSPAFLGQRGGAPCERRRTDWLENMLNQTSGSGLVP